MDQSEQSAETATLSSERLDALIRALSAEPRRMIYAYLAEHDSAPLEELTDVVVGWSRARGRDTEDGSWDDTRTALHHRHLPVLDDAGVITYNPDQRTATLASLSPSTAEVLATITELDTAETDHED
ncbi:MAG: transcriptional regulator [Haloarcula sp.]